MAIIKAKRSKQERPISRMKQKTKYYHKREGKGKGLVTYKDQVNVCVFALDPLSVYISLLLSFPCSILLHIVLIIAMYISCLSSFDILLSLLFLVFPVSLCFCWYFPLYSLCNRCLEIGACAASIPMYLGQLVTLGRPTKQRQVQRT